jgi:serralysin
VALISPVVGTPDGGLLNGTPGADYLVGLEGKDVFTADAGNDTYAGGAGLDTLAYTGKFSDYTLQHTEDGRIIVTDHANGSGVDIVDQVERLLFGDINLALDIDGNAGMAYRLYQAAFDRTPDIPGLGYQMHALDTGLSLTQVAANFIASPEFQGKYGSLDNVHFVTQLYANVLHREPEAEGLAYHVHRLESGATRADVLIGFSESPENQANVIGAIEDGMLYIL